MIRKLRALVMLGMLTMLAACQQGVRPNIEASEPFALASEEAARMEQLPPADNPTPIGGFDSAPANGHGDDVFARIKRNLSTQSCSADSNSKRWRQRYASDPATFAGQLERILPLIDFVSSEVERSGLPAEFVFIPLVESWYKPDAIGHGGPAGMWQMISSTARNHGVHIAPGYDGRLSPVESTRAALSYLKTLQGMFGGWEAIVMAYNAGEGRLMGAFKRSSNRDVSAANRTPRGLSNTTYDYVAKLQALSCLIAEPEKQGLRLPVSARFVPLAPVLVDPEVKTLDQFAASRGQDAIELRRLNPGYKGGRIVAGVPRLVLTPFAPSGSPATAMPPAPAAARPETAIPPAPAAATVAESTEAAPRQSALTHQVRAGDSLWSIANRYSLSIDQLRSINQLDGDSVVQPGQMLRLVP